MTADEQVRTAGPPLFDTRFFGRQQELASLRLLVDGPARLVTLVGAGGSGKTRLAAELSGLIGAGAGSRFANGVVWADLSAVRELGEVASTVAYAVGLGDSLGADPAQALLRTLAEQRLLLIMDNAEDVATQCRGLADALLSGCPGLAVVATSRVPLRSLAEHLLSVPPMDVAASAGERSQAAELFYDRAGRVLPEYPNRADDVAEVNAICRRVDGIPLAIELAAPWIRTLSARDLLAEINRSADVLRSRDPRMSHQHRSMRAVLDSTWRGMGESYRAAMQRLSVFVGGFSGEAAEQVAETSGATLAALVDRSVIHRLPDVAGSSRYGVHELVRSYATEMLQGQGPDEVDRVRDRHLDYFVDLSERAAAQVGTANELRWVLEVRSQLLNTSAALRWARDHDRAEQALRMAAAVFGFWTSHSVSGRHRAEFEAVLTLPWDSGSATQANARADVLSAAGWAAMSHRDWGRAQSHFQQAAAVHHLLGNWVPYGRSLCDVGWAIIRGPEPTSGPGYVRQGLSICQREADPIGIAWSTYDLGEALFAVGQDTDAERLVLDGHRKLTELRVAWGVYCPYVTLGHAYRRQGRWAEAIEAYLGAVGEQQRFLHRTHGADVLAGLGVVALALDRSDCAARLFGAGQTWGERHGDMSALNPSQDLDRPKAVAARRLLNAEWTSNYVAGQRLTTDEALTVAVADAHELLRSAQAPLPLDLSEREMDVVRLVARGLTDSAIADELTLSPRTVQGHLRSVFTKLRVKNRTAAVHRATQIGALEPR